MNRKLQKLTAMLLSLAMLLCLLPVTAAAVEGEQEAQPRMEEITNFGYIPSTHITGKSVTNAYLSGDRAAYECYTGSNATRDPLPSRYDSRDYGYVTSVKNQNPYGSCWAHAAMASIESYMIKHGIPVGEGSAPNTLLNLSETQHCWFNYTYAYDAEGMLTGDKSTSVDSVLNQGGNGEMSAYTLMRWTGAADETEDALKYSNAASANNGLNKKYAYEYDICHVQNTEWIPGTNVEAVKRAIMAYGAGNISYNEGGQGTYICNIPTGDAHANHAITVVGWDDSIAVSRFHPDTPQNPGAWICKNSWGTGQFDNGYCYISYEDTTMNNGYIYFYDAEPIDNYQHNYQYDGSCNVVCYGKGWPSGNDYYEPLSVDSKVANVFTAKGRELLRAVALCNWNEALTYTVEIYKNPQPNNPSSGTLVASQDGYFTFSGYYTIPLETPVKLNPGDTFSVVFTQSSPDGGIYTPYDATFKDNNVVSWCSWIHADHGATSFYQEPNGDWTDCPDNGDYRIKAYTDDISYEITAVSDNEDWGTVELAGNVITATPAEGYYAYGYEVTEGQATVTQNGNVFTVDPDSDCTVKIIFAKKEAAVVHFSVPEGVSCADLNVMTGDIVTLPEPEGDPAVETRILHFIGWLAAPMEEDSTEAPEFFSAGTELLLRDTEVTYYALYSYYVGEGGLDSNQFVLVKKAPESWEGEYVISYNGQYALGATTACFGTNVNNKLGTKKAVVDLAAAGMSCEDGILNNVTDDVTYEIKPAENGTYTVRMKGANQYLAMASDADSLTAYSSSNSDKTRWTIRYDANGPVLANAMYPAYSLQYNDAATEFRAFSSSKKTISLYTQPKGVNWFTTSPKERAECEEHSFGEWETDVEPKCTELGSKHRACTVCGYVETEEIAALNHDYVAGEPVAPKCTEQGYTLYTCSRCEDSYKGDIVDAPGHSWDNGVVTTAPTLTEEGVRTFTCTVCGETKTEPVPVITNPFEDVLESDYFFNPVLWAISQDPQITSGVDATHFGPNNECTREQIVTFLWAANGKPIPGATESQFSDVTADDWYFKAVMWAVENKITSGMSDGSFGVGQPCTRAQAMTFLWASQNKPAPKTTVSPFTDVSEGDWFCKAVLWAAENGITKGVGDGLFGVNNPCTRAQIITFLYKAAMLED